MNTMTQTATPSGSTTGPLFTQALLGGAAAAVANVALYFIARAAGVSLTGEFQPGVPGELPLPAVVISSVLPAVVGAGVALLFRKYTAAPARNFGILAAVFGVLSFGGPASVAQLSTGGLVVMEVMHVFAAVGIGGMLVRALRRG